MKHIFKLISLVLMMSAGCKKTDQPVERIPNSIVLSTIDDNISDVSIKADGIEEVTLMFKIKDKDGSELPLNGILFLNNQRYDANKFKTTVPGKYTFQAFIGDLASNTIVVTAVENLDKKPHKIELTVDKPLIKGDNVDVARLKVEVTNKDGMVLPERYTLMVNGKEHAETEFKTGALGKYVFKAASGSLVSNEIIVEASNDLAGKPYKIILDSDRYLGVIKANNKDLANFKVSVRDVDGKVLNTDYNLLMNGMPFTGAGFKTNIPGEYSFQASIGSLRSNMYSITAQEIAESYVEVQGGSIKGITADNLVTVTIKYKNISERTLKYIGLEVSCYNKAGEIIKEQSKGSTAISCQATGFFEAGLSSSSDFQIGSFIGAHRLEVVLRSVTLDDGTVITAGQ
jgi:hypothetical protein